MKLYIKLDSGRYLEASPGSVLAGAVDVLARHGRRDAARRLTADLFNDLLFGIEYEVRDEPRSLENLEEAIRSSTIQAVDSVRTVPDIAPSDDGSSDQGNSPA